MLPERGTRRVAVLAAAALCSLAIAAPAVAATTDGVDVAGAVWLDLDGDGVRDDGEPGHGGVQVTLRTSATILDAVESSPDGTWWFGNVPPGTYTVTVTTPIDLAITGGTIVGLRPAEGTASITVGTQPLDVGAVGLGSDVANGPDVTATISLDEGSTAERYVWAVGAYNLGPQTAAGPIDLRVVLTAGHTTQDVTGDGWTCERSDAIVLCVAPDDLPAGGALPTLTVVTVPNGDIGTEVTATAAVRLDGTFDGAPLNDEASAQVVISAEVGTADIDGDGTDDLTDAGAPVAATALLGLLSLAVGLSTLRAPRRT